jgi:GTP-binding protein
MYPVVAIIGRPNVGKSTLFNRITGKRQAVTADLAGTTRDRLYAKCDWNSHEFILVDTAGIEVGDAKNSVYARLDSDVQEQVRLAIDEADVILFIVDVQTGPTDQDKRAIKLVFKSGKPFILVANKYDSEKYLPNIADLYSLGAKEVLPIAALTGRGTGDLMDGIADNIKDILPTDKGIELETSGIRVAIVGRPNVGKSSTMNAIIGKNKAVVSEIAGTTRDFTIATLKTEKGNINFIDTAGIRRRGKVGKVEEGKVQGQVEKYSVMRSFRAIDDADLVLLIIDPTEGLTAQDLHIAGYAKDQYKGVIVVVNKWDAVEKDEKDMNRYLAYFHNKISFLPYAPIVFISAKNGKNIDKITDIIFEVGVSRAKHIPTAELNLRLGDDILRKPPSAVRNSLPKINYITQAETDPPTFIFFVNKPELIHFSYKRFLENRIREHWDFTGTPVNLVFKRKNVDYNVSKSKKQTRRGR